MTTMKTGTLTNHPAFSPPTAASTPAGGAETFTLGGDEVVVRARSEETDGALLALEVRIPPGGGPPALHRHAPAELYRVREGELAVYVEDAEGTVRRTAAGPGAVVAIPGGREHTVRNESPAAARADVVFSPGAAMEAFIRAAAALSAPTMAAVLELAERHGIAMTGPLPAAAR
jgi:mannose-6-phosphate isomerase-like protein (cupin superfamily)